MNLIQSIHPTFVEHEGFYYLEFEGEFYKGCKRCGGEGHYSHNGEHSRCYTCDNTSAKLGELIGSDRAAAEKWCHERAVRRAQADRKREAKRLALVAKTEAKQAALKAADPEVFDFIMSIELNDAIDYSTGEYDQEAPKREYDTFLIAMAENLRHVVNCDKPFTDKMVAASRAKMEKRTAKKIEDAASPAPSGRVAVTGEIVSAKATENDFGTAYKILVKDDAGFKVWVSIPSAQRGEAYDLFWGQVEDAGYSLRDFGPDCWFLGTTDGKFTGVKGRRITFTATLEPSKDDAAFAFGSRPTKGAWL